jgi:malonyl-ACP decarboxylase
MACTGMGITTAIGQGKIAVTDALLKGEDSFGVMQRPGRQFGSSKFLGAEIQTLRLPENVPQKLRRTMSWTSQVALATVAEAWDDAQLAGVDPARIGLIVGGSNLQQRELLIAQAACREHLNFLRPGYGAQFMDSDIAALCCEHFGIKGLAYTAGAASASGHLAIVQAIEAVRSGQVDVCIAVGALMDLSYWECQGLRALGAMGSDRFAENPGAASRPFDVQHDGFIYGESCGALVVEQLGRPSRQAYAILRGWSYQVDGHRNPDPSMLGEARAINTAMQMAGVAAADVDYVNPHGTGSALGDAIELQALKACGLASAPINATKSILGHGLTAAGTVEVIATLLQMQAGALHPTRNLQQAIDPSFDWIGDAPRAHTIRNAVNLCFGFGGVNSAICLSRGEG